MQTGLACGFRRCVSAGWLGMAGPLVLAGCQAACPLSGQHHAVQTRLYFGRDVPGGGSVSDAAWSDFAATQLTPAFPDGFTVYEASGQWRSPADGRIGRERTLVVEIVGVVAPARLDAVAGAYRARFRQESVGVVTGEVCARF